MSLYYKCICEYVGNIINLAGVHYCIKYILVIYKYELHYLLSYVHVILKFNCRYDFIMDIKICQESKIDYKNISILYYHIINSFI